MKIILAGGTGFIGTALRHHLIREGHEIVLLTRSFAQTPQTKGCRFVAWDGKTMGAWSAEMNRANAVINLSGESIAARRWTAGRKREIIESRIQSTRVLVEAVKRSATKPQVFINASAVGYYGNVPEGEVTENARKGSDFLAETCDLWEKEASQVEAFGVRRISPRLGVVLEKGGGALAKMIPPFLFYLGGPLGSGRQWFPWIHREDVLGIISFLLKRSDLRGPVNAVSPEPLRMAEFCKALAKAMGRPCWAPVPSFALRLLLGEMAEMLLSGQKVIPSKLLGAGYSFRYPRAGQALKTIFEKGSS